jgi:hypothetical protein
MSITRLITFPILLLKSFIHKSIIFLTFISILFTILNRIGIIERLLQIYIEREVSRLSNGAPITITNLEIQLLNIHSLQSTITLHDSIVHTPDQYQWKWESPLIARIGYARITVNPFSFLDLPMWCKALFGIRTNAIKDIYTLEINDVQVFIEKRRNVFNFHLLDDRLDLPNADKVLDSLDVVKPAAVAKSAAEIVSVDHPIPGHVISKSTGGSGTSGEGRDVHMDSLIGNDMNMEKDEDLEGAKKADQLVTSIVQAVSSLGRAANEGGSEGLSNAFRNQKDGFVRYVFLLLDGSAFCSSSYHDIMKK